MTSRLLLLLLLLARPLQAYTALPADATAPPASFKTADDLWIHIDRVSHGYDAAAGDNRLAWDHPIVASTALFISTYPTDERLPKVRILWAHSAARLLENLTPDAPSLDQISKTLDVLSADATLSREQLGMVQALQIRITLLRLMYTFSTDHAAWTAVDDQLTAYIRHYGADFTVGDWEIPSWLRTQELHAIFYDATSHDPEVLDRLTHDSDPKIAQEAKAAQDAAKVFADLRSRPFELKGETVEGKHFDIADLRGKVVLIHFWASWSGSCRDEIPDVIAAFKKYHARGLEIVGVSYDTDKGALVDFSRQQGMSWPQLFGLVPHGDLTSPFFIGQIPTIWVIDQKGMLGSTIANYNLDATLEHLLPATP